MSTSVSIRQAVDNGRSADLSQKIANLIIEIGQYRGITITPEDALIAAGFYVKDLANEFPRIETTDIRTIFYKGIRKDFGDFYGLNAGTFHDWTKAYVQSDEFQSVLHDRVRRPSSMQIAETRTMTKEEEFRILKDSINRAYKAFLSDDYKVEEGTIGEGMSKMFVGGYPLGHPLCDLGKARVNFLNENGIPGTLCEIFTRAKANGKEVIL